jgi:prepilin-type N-terminal cleavage/methylation domain-containing protein
MTYFRFKLKGFTLIELLLVMAIMSSILVAILGYTTQRSDEMRRDRAVMQVQQILSAGLAYYVNIGAWPDEIKDLQDGSYLPSGTMNNPWGLAYAIKSPAFTNAPTFSICSSMTGKNSYAAATIIAGRLPMASVVDGSVITTTTPPPAPPAPPAPPITTTTCPTTNGPCTKDSTSCTVISSVTIPGQNLNNARSINFAGLYHNGACVAAPACPLNMVPTIVVTPVSISGMNDPGNTIVYPITSFTAYAAGESTDTGLPGLQPLDCTLTQKTDCDMVTTEPPTPATTGSYWRVCVNIVTQKGVVNKAGGNPNWAKDAAVVLALTRCMPASEPTTPAVSGSAFKVFINN